MELFFGDELLNVSLPLFEILLQLDLEPFDLCLHFLPGRRAETLRFANTY